MKKLHLLLLSVTLFVFSACHNDIWDAIDGLDSRVTKLEELCKEMNTNITSLQTIVSVLQSNDFITGIVEIKKNGEVIGYTITFGKHDPITIYHGQDGKDGADGKDGQDGQNGSTNAPVIGVAQDTDGVYYWTLNGEWLLDDNGNKLPVSGKDGQNGSNGSNGQDGADGKDGQNGEDGKDGADGQDGKDGITPQLKIEDGYWYISYDNGATWTQLGKATGEDGKDGQNGTDGKDGQDGDSMFQSVTQDENYVYFTLADGTIIKIAKGNGNSQPNEDFIFTITYDPNGGEGVIVKDTFYYGYANEIIACPFSKKGYFFTQWNTNPEGRGAPYHYGNNITIDKNITLYAQWEEGTYEYVDLGLSVKWAVCNIGATKQESYGDKFAWGEITPKTTFSWENYSLCNGENKMTKYCTYSGFGTVDYLTILEPCDDAASAILGNNWHMPTDKEIEELLTQCSWEWTAVNNVKGYLITSRTNKNCIFLPAAGFQLDGMSWTAGGGGAYWSNTLNSDNSNNAFCLEFDKDSKRLMGGTLTDRRCGLNIRPVCP